MTTLRAFVAVALPDDVRCALAALQHQLRPGLPAAWSRPTGMHLTLHFLGDVESNQLDDITGALETTCARHEPFSSTARGLGVFPGPRRPRVLWAGLTDAGPLVELQQALCGPLETCGVPIADRTYRPHLTLARFSGQPGRQGLSSLRSILQNEQRDFGTVPVEEVRLYRSELLPGRAHHTLLSTARLGR